MKAWRTAAVVGFVVSVFAASSSVPAQGATQQTSTADANACEVHVWQSNDFRSTVSYPYLPGNVALQSAHDSKHPNSVVDQMAYELRSERIAGLIESAPWMSYIHHPVNVVVEPAVVDKQLLKTIKSGTSRNSSSYALCYYELYIGEQSFVKSYVTGLFTKFTLRMFNANGPSSTEAIAFSEVKGFSKMDAAAVDQAIRDTFTSNVGKFLSFRSGKLVTD